MRSLLITTGMLAGLLMSLPGGIAAQTTLAEEFNDPFPAWESGWFGENTDAVNYYCSPGIVSGDCNSNRGNNPYGLWLGADVHGDIVVNFLNDFGAGLTTLSMEIGAYAANTTFRVYDFFGAIIYDQAVAAGNMDSGEIHIVNSITGFSRFVLSAASGYATGNTSVDDVSVITGTSVPEPASLILIGMGILGVAGAGVRRLGKAALYT